MAMDWSIARVPNWQALAEDETQDWISRALGIALHQAGVAEITPKNAAVVYARVACLETMGGKYRRGEHGDFIQPLDVVRRIGMSTNASPVSGKKFMDWAQAEAADRDVENIQMVYTRALDRYSREQNS